MRYVLPTWNQCCGSGSAFIFAPTVDLDPGGKIFRKKHRKKCKESGINCYFCSVKFGSIAWFFTFGQSFCLFQLQKTLPNTIVYKFFKAGSSLRKTAGSGSAKNECGSTALLGIANNVEYSMF